jgi:F0F1-type ATP synthase assembly protein I
MADDKTDKTDKPGEPDEPDTPDADESREIYPEPPDARRVDELRRRLRSEQASSSRPDRFTQKVGNSARDLGTYTLIPTLMIAGPLVGFLVGRGVEKLWGGAPWGAVGGLLLGVAAGFREVILLLKRRDGK